ncbi:MAG: SIS domain-containing protein [Candidatus Taylorbacteria bacterium]
MEEAIQKFAKQFTFEPEIVNAESLKLARKFLVCGLGGSHLAVGLLKMREPSMDIFIHRDYGLPGLLDADLKERFCIASSYSGNTEETLDFAEKAFEKGLQIAVIATGGKLIDFAKKHELPYIVIPSTGIQPRMALGYALKSLVKLMGREALNDELTSLSRILKPESLRKSGEELALSFEGKVPVIYTSNSNKEIAYNWKIKFNETGKIPAFFNVFPELNHNEMTGFDVIPSTKELSSKFHFFFIEDASDHPNILKRMKICRELFEKRGLPVTMMVLAGSATFEKVFNSLTLADWTAYYTALHYGAEPEQVPMVEEFKKMMR